MRLITHSVSVEWIVVQGHVALNQRRRVPGQGDGGGMGEGDERLITLPLKRVIV